VSIEKLRSAITQHQELLSQLQAQKLRLEAAPSAPPGRASADELLTFFDNCLTQSDELEAVMAAIKEITARLATLQSRLADAIIAQSQEQELAKAATLRRELLNSLH
jgi:hypothetical protein